jgi:hypothetical protein
MPRCSRWHSARLLPRGCLNFPSDVVFPPYRRPCSRARTILSARRRSASCSLKDMVVVMLVPLSSMCSAFNAGCPGLLQALHPSSHGVCAGARVRRPGRMRSPGGASLYISCGRRERGLESKSVKPLT